ncbi:hypothetical protein [Fulvivirga ligni]|uniref:hypothetical protein n=1 Tax=Fulvivirga ligni TaxID=2904246 RepID=UPI001F1DCD05|nr:hypothetical protein [Fulvivirga ligni]UII19172.1 hypothetical protein LVD16_15105 [Fulvivirga ligni]
MNNSKEAKAVIYKEEYYKYKVQRDSYNYHAKFKRPYDVDSSSFHVGTLGDRTYKTGDINPL